MRHCLRTCFDIIITYIFILIIHRWKYLSRVQFSFHLILISAWRSCFLVLLDDFYLLFCLRMKMMLSTIAYCIQWMLLILLCKIYKLINVYFCCAQRIRRKEITFYSFCVIYFRFTNRERTSGILVIFIFNSSIPTIVNSFDHRNFYKFSTIENNEDLWYKSMVWFHYRKIQYEFQFVCLISLK